MLRIDLHLHSEFSPDSRTPLDQLVEACARVGLDQVALTDHNTAAGALELALLAPDLAIVGEEVRTDQGEIIGLFMSSSLPARITAVEACDLIHGMGGLTYAAHPFDRRRAHFDQVSLDRLGDRLDIVEVYNPWSGPEANLMAEEYCRARDKIAATGSDAHSVEELGLSWMEIDDYGDSADFLLKLRSARHVVTPLSGRAPRTR
ncbi:MAG TPA: PHP domain-containing protein [Candidatus Nitrosotalea sp.]|nr:PHP domain-containing protein [Candidatus Nitrosotalea sp.]